jgi:hypothetical protein
MPPVSALIACIERRIMSKRNGDRSRFQIDRKRRVRRRQRVRELLAPLFAGGKGPAVVPDGQASPAEPGDERSKS